MPKHRRGDKKRAAILKELYRRELALEPSPTAAELAVILAPLNDGKPVGVKTVYFHLVAMRDAEPPLVTWLPLVARTLRLTDAGRARVTKTGT